MTMGDAPRIVTGWDLGDGGGSRVRYLPCELTPLVLAPASGGWVFGESARYAICEVWGCDPRVTVAVALFFAPSADEAGTPYNIATSEEGMTILALTRVRGQVAPVCRLPPSELFVNGGHIGHPWEFFGDGVELATAAQGIRFVIPLRRSGNTARDVLATVVARPNVALQCRDLAIELAQGMTATVVEQARF